MTSPLFIGMRVHYVPRIGAPENGIVKSFNDRVAWVVYHCDGNWDRYANYTGASTVLEDLREGWVNERKGTKCT